MKENHYRILIMHNKTEQKDVMKLHLEGGGHQISEAAELSDIIGSGGEKKGDLVIIETESGDVKAFTMVREIRRNSVVPIILLIRQGRMEDRVLGMNLGADDCLELPLEPLELGAKVNAMLRRCYELDRPGSDRGQEAEESVLHYEELELNMSTLRLIKNGRPVLLTPKEYRLMLNMMNEPGRVFSKEELCGMIFDEAIRSDANALMVHISHLREKIEEDPKRPRYIFNIRGKGYSFGKTQS